MAKPPLLIHGMHGMGDCLHSRAVVRLLMQKWEVWLQSSWYSLFDGLTQDGLHVVYSGTSLRTQTKNAKRERHLFDKTPIPNGVRSITIRYTGGQVRDLPSHTVLEAMCKTVGVDFHDPALDFRFNPVPQAWLTAADELIAQWKPTKPLLIYRPLTIRPEWRGGESRNAEQGAYRNLFAEIRDRFFVVSIADLVEGHEWMAGQKLKADVEVHDGSIPFETLAGVFARANLIYCSGGFAAILAQAVSAPVISIIGRYENALATSYGAKFSPYLGIDPPSACTCMISTCRNVCSKVIDLPPAKDKVNQFVTDLGYMSVPEGARTPLDQMYGPLGTPPVRTTQLNRPGVYHMRGPGLRA